MKHLAAAILLILCASLTFATSTDGNYTLLQYEFKASGETATDTNYVSFASAGEAFTSTNIADQNYSAGIGFLGEPLTTIAAAIVSAITAAAATTFLIIMAPTTNTNFLLLLGGIVVIAVFFIVLSLRKNE